MAKQAKQKRDLYQEVTDKIIAQLEKGSAPWLKPWADDSAQALVGFPHNASSARSYSGVNVLLLWMAEMENNFKASSWLTFKQAKELGGNVIKGQKGSMITYWSTFKKENSLGEKEEIPFLKSYTVFNIEQCENLNTDKLKTVKAYQQPEGFAHVQEFIDATGANITHGGNKAFFAPGPDKIAMPHPEQFNDLENYYATLLHELTHWSGSKKRLNREMGKRFGDNAYDAEELIAEMGAAFLCAQHGLTGELQHADYIQTWLKVLKEDKRAIFTAASKATKAAEYLTQFNEAQQLAA